VARHDEVMNLNRAAAARNQYGYQPEAALLVLPFSTLER